ncbi:cobalt-precorrin-6A reductase [Pinisolibacter aquiterrae]|uniref:cobalt-precorrin-6A reductase n=1 Tax=Pinisolibacter aquiterrae TaxID=2815579 RepID=UPI001C3D116E|nr:cobalt-precorrin-6A reductase [Pinisolibacter aquiterrae]MBV5264972.1 cobalt-precorrin-6A reductase [Pinisolibacter aquiterrae]MCC8235646.1 cobalt-precorrin-6A reductase [Pinisolibacter aquiterrae]
MRILVLGGTTEASRLAKALAERADIEATLSLAGRTVDPAAQPIPTRIGGFGGVEGLAAHLRDHAIDALVDATHPFAAQISRNAAEAARVAGTPIVAFVRPAWTRAPGDDWREVASLEEAAAAIGAAPKRVLLTTGRLGLASFEIAPQHHYVIRTIDPPGDLPGLPDHALLLDRGPFDLAAERALMERERIEVVVTKNSGGAATYPKIVAARELGLPVVIQQPPTRPDVPRVGDVAGVFAFLNGVGKA